MVIRSTCVPLAGDAMVLQMAESEQVERDIFVRVIGSQSFQLM